MDLPVALEEVLVTGELVTRPCRLPRWQAECRALQLLGRHWASRPEKVLEMLVEVALELCEAGTTGVSLIEEQPEGKKVFRWVAMAGTLASYIGGTTPYDFSPCGTCLELGNPQLYAYPERRFTYFAAARPVITEGLVIPLVLAGRPIGTFWIAAHDETRRFDGEDVRVMANLAEFTAAALAGIEQTRLAREAQQRAEAARAQLERHERERERLLAEAEGANRAKDEFLAILSHELRTPLNPIIGWTQMLRRGGLSPAQQLQALETIERNAKLQNQLIADLLDVSRIEQDKFAFRPVPMALTPVLQAAVEAVRQAAEQGGVTLQIHLQAEHAMVHGDPTRLQQVVWNLLTNAVKFTPTGGQVEVRLSADAVQAQISVRDTGEGIAPLFLPVIFERFRQVDTSTTRRQGGLGLGLFIVRRIVELHGGTVAAESQGIGQGSTFTVTLPLLKAEAALDRCGNLPEQPLQNASPDLSERENRRQAIAEHLRQQQQ